MFWKIPKSLFESIKGTFQVSVDFEQLNVQKSFCAVTINIIFFNHNLNSLISSVLMFLNSPPCRFSPCRFGKKKEEKKEAKAAQQKSDLLSDHELQRMKDERERWV